MNNIKKVHELFLKAMEGVGSSASKLASNANYKVTEMNLSTHHRELIEGMGKLSYELWQKGVKFPAEIEKQLLELSEVDEKLAKLKAEHFSYINPEIDKNEKTENTEDDEEVSSNETKENSDSLSKKQDNQDSDNEIEEETTEETTHENESEDVHFKQFNQQTGNYEEELKEKVEKVLKDEHITKE